MRSIVCLLLCAAFSSTAAAVARHNDRGTVAVIRRYDGSRMRGGASGGSCSLICSNAKVSYWITAWHVLDGSRGAISVEPEPGVEVPARLIGADERSDLAVVMSSQVEYVPVYVVTNKLQGTCYAEGYAGASHNRFGRRKGRYAGDVDGGRGMWTLPSIPGDSGGLIFQFTDRKYLCGVTSTSDFRTRTYGPHERTIRSYLTGLGFTVSDAGKITCKRVLGGRDHRLPVPDS